VAVEFWSAQTVVERESLKKFVAMLRTVFDQITTLHGKRAVFAVLLYRKCDEPLAGP
jgi:hypothetical protein